MLRSGVPLTTALSLVADAVDNEFMGEKIREMRRNIERGESLVRVSAQVGLFTPLVMQMLAVGEETGKMDDMLTEVAVFYEREVEFALEAFLHDLHVQQTEEAAAESETQGTRGFRYVRD